MLASSVDDHAHRASRSLVTCCSDGQVATAVGRFAAQLPHGDSWSHPQHRLCANEVLAALPDVVIATGHPRRAYHSDGYNNLDQHGRPLELPTIIDVSAHCQTKLETLAVHESQPITDHFGPMAEALGSLHGRRIGTDRAEAF
jgi:N-acetylglucosamine malate deacetylase 1